MNLLLSVLISASFLACGDKDDSGATDGGGSDGGTADGGGSGECNTDNEACAPGSCNGDGAEMLPGSNCMACHSEGNWEEDEDEALWTVAGTAFVDADGTDGLSGAVIRITDANGDVEELHSNDVGNFYSRANLVPPLSAEIVVGTETLSMVQTVDTGACSSCHSCEGEASGKLYGP